MSSPKANSGTVAGALTASKSALNSMNTSVNNTKEEGKPGVTWASTASVADLGRRDLRKSMDTKRQEIEEKDRKLEEKLKEEKHRREMKLMHQKETRERRILRSRVNKILIDEAPLKCGHYKSVEQKFRDLDEVTVDQEQNRAAEFHKKGKFDTRITPIRSMFSYDTQKSNFPMQTLSRYLTKSEMHILQEDPNYFITNGGYRDEIQVFKSKSWRNLLDNDPYFKENIIDDFQGGVHRSSSTAQIKQNRVTSMKSSPEEIMRMMERTKSRMAEVEDRKRETDILKAAQNEAKLLRHNAYLEKMHKIKEHQHSQFLEERAMKEDEKQARVRQLKSEEWERLKFRQQVVRSKMSKTEDFKSNKQMKEYMTRIERENLRKKTGERVTKKKYQQAKDSALTNQFYYSVDDFKSRKRQEQKFNHLEEIRMKANRRQPNHHYHHHPHIDSEDTEVSTLEQKEHRRLELIQEKLIQKEHRAYIRDLVLQEKVLRKRIYDTQNLERVEMNREQLDDQSNAYYGDIEQGLKLKQIKAEIALANQKAGIKIGQIYPDRAKKRRAIVPKYKSVEDIMTQLQNDIDMLD